MNYVLIFILFILLLIKSEVDMLNTNNKEVINIRENQFAKASQEFGTKKENLSRVNQVSPGDGNKFISVPNKTYRTN